MVQRELFEFQREVGAVRSGRALARSQARLGGLAVAVGLSGCNRTGHEKVTVLIPQVC